MKINYEQFSIICRSLDILQNVEIECFDEKRNIHRIDSELRAIRNIGLSKLDAEDQKSAILRIEEMLGEVVKYLESDGYGFAALNLSNVMEQIGEASKCD